MKKNFVDEDGINGVVSDVENYISKNYEPSILEYDIILSMLKERLQKKKNDAVMKAASNNIMGDAFKKLGLPFGH